MRYRSGGFGLFQLTSEETQTPAKTYKTYGVYPLYNFDWKDLILN